LLLTVIIPTRCRHQRLEALLDSLSRQVPVPFAWEVLIVDNASSDHTADVVRQKTRTFPVTIRYVFEATPGLHNGRHRGAREAGGELVAYLDDDMVVAPTWILGAEGLIQKRSDAVVGRILPKWEADPPAWLRHMVGKGIFSHLGLLDLGPVAKEIDPLFVFGGNCFLPRKLIFDLGGFHPDAVPPDMIRYRGDGETALMRQFKRKGLKSYYDPQALAFHLIGPDRMTTQYLCRRAHHQGISDSFMSIRDGGTEHDFRTVMRKLMGQIMDFLTRNRERQQMRRAYWQGFAFHQGEVKRDASLYQWVMKKDYFLTRPETGSDNSGMDA
jgi:glycosyltransferase involved in cell wall biosynthesis